MATTYPRTQWDPGPVQSVLTFLSGAVVHPGKAIQISCAVAGTVTLTAVDGTTCVCNPVAGDNIYPYAVITATTGTVGTPVYTNLY